MSTALATTEPAELPAKGSAAPINAKEKQLRAMELRNQGYRWDEIAERVGYKSGKAAANAVRKLRSKHTLEAVTDYRAMQIDRCHRMLVALNPRIEAGNEQAISTALRVLDKLDKYIDTETATEAKVEHTHRVILDSGSTEDDYVKSLQQVAPPMEALPQGTVIPEGHFMADVVDAELVER